MSSDKIDPRLAVIDRINDVAREVVADLKAGRVPKLREAVVDGGFNIGPQTQKRKVPTDLPPRDPAAQGSSLDPDEDYYGDFERSQGGGRVIKKLTLRRAPAFAGTLVALAHSHSLLSSDSTCTTRELYYHHTDAFSSQNMCNEAIFAAARIVGVERAQLGIYASPKGWIVGRVVFEGSGGRVDCSNPSSPSGVAITGEWLSPTPPGSEGGTTFSSDAQCIVVVEKEGAYLRLSEDRAYDDPPAIFITGKGFPDLATRAAVRNLSLALKIPVFGIADCNPFGLSVLMTYRSGGTFRSSVSPDLYASDVRWLGLRPSQIPPIASRLPDGVYQTLTDTDRGRCEQIANLSFIKENKEWADELNLWLESGTKMEIEALGAINVDYISRVWLKGRIQDGDYL